MNIKAKSLTLAGDFGLLVRITGLEPAHLAVQEPKSCVSANSTTSAYSVYLDILIKRACDSCGSQNSLRLSSPMNFDRCAFSLSLLRPPDAVKLKAANSTTPAYSYILYAQNTVVSRKKYINFITFILLDISSSNFIMLFKTPTFKLKVGVIFYFLWWDFAPHPTNFCKSLTKLCLFFNSTAFCHFKFFFNFL